MALFKARHIIRFSSKLQRAAACMLLLAGLFALGCKDERGQGASSGTAAGPSGPLEACAAQQCSFGLAVRFPGLPVGAYRIEVKGGATAEQHSCQVRFPETQAGPQGSLSHVGGCAILAAQTPERARVTIQGPRRSLSREFTPTYAVAKAGCPSRCKQAVVVFDAAGLKK